MQGKPSNAKKLKAHPQQHDFESLFRFYYWHKHYLEVLQEKHTFVGHILSPDLTFAEDEIEGFIVNAELTKQLLFKLDDDLFLFDSSRQYHPPQHYLHYLRIAELAARYASRTMRSPRPVFSVEDYTRQNIAFKLLFKITQHLRPTAVMSILLYDNYETGNPESFQLRFEWWQPIGLKRIDTDFLSHNNHPASLDRLRTQIVQHFGEQLATVSLMPSIKTQLRVFQNDPITIDYSHPLHEYRWDANLTATSPEWSDDWYNSVNGQLALKLQSQSAEDCLSEMFPAVPLQPMPRIPSLRSYWDRDICQNIQSPKVNFSHYANRIVANNPLGDQLHCLYFNGVFPDEVKDLVRRLTKYLGLEIGARATYDGSDACELFLVMNLTLDRCLGYLLLTNVNRQQQINKFNNFAIQYRQAKPQAEFNVDFFKQKRANNITKLAAAKANNPPDPFDFFDRESAEEEKYQHKSSLYNHLQFFAAAQAHWPQETIIKQLMFAWIHPFHRRQGIMSQLWNHLHIQYNHIIEVDHPSTLMTQFIAKNSVAIFEYSEHTLTTK